MKQLPFLPSELAASARILPAILAIALPVCAESAQSPAEGAQFFREKVHPILQSNCYKCHGGEKIKAGLVLTHREGLVQGGENGSALDSSDPQKSLFLDMVSYRDASHEMPPSGKLPSGDIAILNQWIALGAPYDPALEKKIVVQKKEPAKTEETAWWAYQPVRPITPPAKGNAHPVDAFLQKSLTSAGLQFNPPASRETLVRRAYYDLIGLPPSPEEVRSFVQDKSPDAWPRLIDTLLSKPEYGEKWARHWMDVVRYAESEGFERDSDKPNIWRYRDFLIEAFNADLPYNQFVTEQIAGDEMDPPTQRSLTATGFLRLMQYDDEPADRLQAKYDILADIVQVTGEAFLGMSIGCARCHDHKKDPISQKDYYSFMSFFHGMHDYGPTRTKPVQWLTEEDRKTFQEKQAQTLAGIQSEIASLEKLALEWLETHRKGILAKIENTLLFDSSTADSESWKFTQNSQGTDWKFENFSADKWPTDAVVQPGSPVWMRARFGLNEALREAWLEFEYAGETEIFLNGVPILNSVNLPPGKHAFVLGKNPRLHTGVNTIAVRTNAQSGMPHLRVLRNKPALQVALDLLQKSDKTVLEPLNQLAKTDVVSRLKTRLDAWYAEATRVQGTPLSAVTETTLNPPPLAIHRRGNPNVPGESVEPAFPAALTLPNLPQQPQISPVAKRSSGRRLALSRWMTDPANPLLSRVAVNRIWQHHFGRGIVPSSNDFGRLGELPSHPELLDWLSSTFIEKGWSLKTMHKLLMTSAAYQQSSANLDAGASKDPENKLLWRYPMRRLTAEELRDSILSMAGILQLKTYGPPVHPPLPRAVLETQSRPGSGWPVQSLMDSARRSVYVHVKRSLSVPLLADHDQAATDTPCAMRFVSTVPTQALGMLNSEFMNEQARLFANRLIRDAGADPEKQIQHGLTLILQRDPTPQEVSFCKQTLQKFQNQFTLTPDQSLQRLALMLLNLNEFLYID